MVWVDDDEATLGAACDGPARDDAIVGGVGLTRAGELLGAECCDDPPRDVAGETAGVGSGA